jgi:hypothetical protein
VSAQLGHADATTTLRWYAIGLGEMFVVTPGVNLRSTETH